MKLFSICEHVIEGGFMLLRLVIINFVFTSLLFCQVPDNIQRFRDDDKGNYANRKQGTFVGNRIQSIYSNDGEIGKWEFAPSCEWPALSGHNYLDGYTFMVSSEVTAPGDTQVIHPLETAYREYYSLDPATGVPWGFEPIGGYSNPQSTSPAISSDRNSWPAQWPAALNLTPDYDGHWYGYFGKDSIKAAEETFYVLDDSPDKKFTLAPFSYFPISSDSARGGLGLREEVRGFQWNDSLRKDIVFLKYDIWNISDYDYDKAAFGIFCDPGVGGANSTEPPNSVAVDSIRGLIYAWAPSGLGTPGNWKTGYLGVGILSVPLTVDSNFKLSLATGTLADKSSHGLWPKNNDVMWKAMTGGIMDTSIVSTNISFVIGTGPFVFEKWTNEEFVSAIIMGNDLEEILDKKAIAQAIYDNDFVIPDSLFTPMVQVKSNLPTGFELYQNFPNPFNLSTTIYYRLSKNSFVTVRVFDVLGRQIKTLVNERQIAGIHTIAFDGSGLASGVYSYRLTTPEANIVKRMVLAK